MHVSVCVSLRFEYCKDVVDCIGQDFLDFLVIHRHTFFSNVKDYTEVSDY